MYRQICCSKIATRGDASNLIGKPERHDSLCPYPSHPYPWQCFYCDLIIKVRKDEKNRAKNIEEKKKYYGD